MKKRGPIVGFVGAGITMVAFLAVLSVAADSDPTVNGQLLLPDLLGELFTKVSDEAQIYPGSSHTFSYASSTPEIPLLWGLQVTDYQEGDKFTITASNIYGDDLGTFEQAGPVLFDTFIVPNSETIDFQVQNTGERPISALMMFVEDPDNSEALTDPNSPLLSLLVPLAISGILLMAGMGMAIAGAILSLVDWRKTKDQSGIF